MQRQNSTIKLINSAPSASITSKVRPIRSHHANVFSQRVDPLDPTPPVTPGAQRFIPREDRETIVFAFRRLQKSPRQIAHGHKPLTQTDVENVIREHIEATERRANLFSSRFNTRVIPIAAERQAA